MRRKYCRHYFILSVELFFEIPPHIPEDPAPIPDLLVMVQRGQALPLTPLPLRGRGRALLPPEVGRQVPALQRQVLLRGDHLGPLLPPLCQHCLQVPDTPQEECHQNFGL